MRHDALLAKLRETYSDAPTFEITEDGVWVATPTCVVAQVCARIAQLAPAAARQLGRPLRVVDAGCADGRWLYGLALWSESVGECVAAFGVESDAGLAAVAQRHLAGCAFAAHHGNYLTWQDPWPLSQADVVLNYPDGSEQALANLLCDTGAELWVVNPELRLKLLGRAPDKVVEIATDALPWRVCVFGRGVGYEGL